jgi:hypothetical protein
MNPKDFHAEDGELVAPALKSFSRFIFSQTNVTIQGPARVISTTRGKQVIFEPEAEIFPGSFQVSKVGPKTLSVSEGLVGGLVPYLEEVRLDGLDEKGEPLPEGKPVLECTAPETGGRTYVLLWARHTDAGDADETIPQDSGDPAAYLVHAEELPPGMRADDRVARLVAVLYWNKGQIEKIRQVVWYDQEVWPSGGKARLRAAA